MTDPDAGTIPWPLFVQGEAPRWRLLQGFTEQAAQILDPSIRVNPLCNWGFMSFAAVFLVLAVIGLLAWRKTMAKAEEATA